MGKFSTGGGSGNSGGDNIINGIGGGNNIGINSGTSNVFGDDQWLDQLATSVFRDEPAAASQQWFDQLPEEDKTMLTAGMDSILNGAFSDAAAAVAAPVYTPPKLDPMSPSAKLKTSNSSTKPMVSKAKTTNAKFKVSSRSSSKITGRLDNGSQVMDHDILMGHSNCRYHPGNLHYLGAKQMVQAQYAKANNNMEKTAASQEVVDLAKQWGGQFIKRDVNTNLWSEVDNLTARRKASQGIEVSCLVEKQGNSAVC
jgi:hypothetical protein